MTTSLLQDTLENSLNLCRNTLSPEQVFSTGGGEGWGILSPQGHLAMSETYLIVTTGRDRDATGSTG